MNTPDYLITARARDLGGFKVARALPHASKRMCGPFIFLDEMGPASFAPGMGIDVRPHPHIGLATVTWLFDGELTHRDNTGAVQSIRPGDVNWMIAGRGVVHSERTGDEVRAAGHRIHGIQCWVASPVEAEEVKASFHHIPARDLPRIAEDGMEGVLILGELFGATSPVPVQSPIFYASISLKEGARLSLQHPTFETGIYVVDGELSTGDTTISPGQIAIWGPGHSVSLVAAKETRAMLLGGEPFAEARHIDWNLVSSRPERIEQAKADWRAGPQTSWSHPDFALPSGEDEYIPLPE